MEEAAGCFELRATWLDHW